MTVTRSDIRECRTTVTTAFRFVSGGKTLGVINTYLNEGHRKDPEEEGFLTSAADALSGVIIRKNTELQLKDSVVRLSRTTKQTILAISRISEEVNQYTAGHQRRVAKLARAIAEEMGLSPERTEGIEIAGLVHDIGKVAIPPSILSKPGRLNEFEMGLVRGHSTTGYNILKEVDFPWPIAKIVLQHHERLDGSGYPDGVSGDDILEEAGIVTVADVLRPCRRIGRTGLRWVSARRSVNFHGKKDRFMIPVLLKRV